MLKRFVGFVVISAILAGLAGIVVVYLYGRHSFGEGERRIHIPHGTTVKSIAKILSQEGVVENDRLFLIYLYIYGTAQNVRAGDYHFELPLSPEQVAAMLLKGDFKTYRFTVPEGWNLQQIAQYLVRKGLSEEEEFLEACRDVSLISQLSAQAEDLEGYLFPSTYETYFPESSSELVSMMIDEFKKNFTDEMKQRAKRINLTVHEVITLASIVEKETGKAEERPLIASVFHNRLTKKMPLQSDPTVIYGIKDFDGNLTRYHLNTYSPYNTYQIPGLPPGPIASPGRESILAVLYPAETDFLYFVSKNDGSHSFSKTLKEHQSKVQHYQVLRKEEPWSF
jgi:UPF0755 protein